MNTNNLRNFKPFSTLETTKFYDSDKTDISNENDLCISSRNMTSSSENEKIHHSHTTDSQYLDEYYKTFKNSADHSEYSNNHRKRQNENIPTVDSEPLGDIVVEFRSAEYQEIQQPLERRCKSCKKRVRTYNREPTTNCKKNKNNRRRRKPKSKPRPEWVFDPLPKVDKSSSVISKKSDSPPVNSLLTTDKYQAFRMGCKNLFSNTNCASLSTFSFKRSDQKHCCEKCAKSKMDKYIAANLTNFTYSDKCTKNVHANTSDQEYINASNNSISNRSAFNQTSQCYYGTRARGLEEPANDNRSYQEDCTNLQQKMGKTCNQYAGAYFTQSQYQCLPAVTFSVSPQSKSACVKSFVGIPYTSSSSDYVHSNVTKETCSIGTQNEDSSSHSVRFEDDLYQGAINDENKQSGCTSCNLPRKHPSPTDRSSSRVTTPRTTTTRNASTCVPSTCDKPTSGQSPCDRLLFDPSTCGTSPSGSLPSCLSTSGPPPSGTSPFDSSTCGPPPCGTSSFDPSICGPSPCGTSPFDSSICGPSPCGTSPFDSSICGPSPCGTSSFDPSICGPSPCGTSSFDPSICGPSPCGTSSFDPSACDPSLFNPSTCVPSPYAPSPFFSSYCKLCGLSPYDPSSFCSSPYGLCDQSTCGSSLCSPLSCGSPPCVPLSCGISPCGPSSYGPSICDQSTCGPSLCSPFSYGSPPCDASTSVPLPCGPLPCGPSPCGPSPCAPILCGPTPCGPNPCGPNPCVPNPCGPNPSGPNPRGPSPFCSSPCSPFPCSSCRTVPFSSGSCTYSKPCFSAFQPASCNTTPKSLQCFKIRAFNKRCTEHQNKVGLKTKPPSWYDVKKRPLITYTCILERRRVNDIRAKAKNDDNIQPNVIYYEMMPNPLNPDQELEVSYPVTCETNYCN